MKKPDVWISVGVRGFPNQEFEPLRGYDIKKFRINTGRCTLDWAYKSIAKLVSMGYSPKDIYVDIGNNKPRLSFNGCEKIELFAGKELTISNDPTTTADAWVKNGLFFSEIKNGDILYFGDGELECSASIVASSMVKLKSISNGLITNNVAIGIKGREFSRFYIHQEEIDGINKLLQEYQFSIILSFVETSENVAWARTQFPLAAEVIPKIETASSVSNIKAILAENGTIFLGRGDLGLSVGIEAIGVIQKQIVTASHKAGCYVAVGAGILDSLKWNQTPLRAEILDITNLCVDAVDAIVLTSETAGTTTPYRALDWLFKTLGYIEESI